MDGRQPNQLPARHFHIVQPDQADVTGHRQPRLFNGAQRTDRQKIIAAEIGLGRGVRQQPLHLCAARIKAVICRIGCGDLDLRIRRQRPQKPRHAVLRRGGGSRPAQKGQAPIAPLHQSLRRHPPAGHVVDAHNMYIRRNRRAPKGMHHRQACVLERLGKAGRQGGRGHDHPIHRILPQHLDRRGRVRRIAQVDQQRPQPTVLQTPGEKIKHLKDQRVVKVVDDQPDQLGPPGGQRRGERIGRIAQIIRRFFHLGARLGRHRRAFGKAARHRRA